MALLILPIQALRSVDDIENNGDQNQHHHRYTHDDDDHVLRALARLSLVSIIAHAHTLLFIAGSVQFGAGRRALVVLLPRIALDSHHSFLAGASPISEVLVVALPMSRADQSFLVPRAFSHARRAPEPRDAVLAVHARIPVSLAHALPRSIDSIAALAVSIARRARLALQSPEPCLAFIAHILRAPALLAHALPASLLPAIALPVRTSLAGLARRAEIARQTVLAVGRGVVARLAAETDAVGTLHGDLHVDGVLLLFLLERVDADVVVAVGAEEGMVAGQRDLREIVAHGGVHPGVVLDRRRLRDRHEQLDVLIGGLEARSADGDGSVVGLVEVERGVNTSSKRDNRALARNVGLQRDRDYALEGRKERKKPTIIQVGVDAPGSHVGGANRHSENAVVAPARLVFCDRNGEFIASGEPGVVRIGGVVLRVDDEAGFGHAQIDIEPDAVRRVHIPRVRDVR